MNKLYVKAVINNEKIENLKNKLPDMKVTYHLTTKPVKNLSI
ncbi:hypothetical protein CNEO2_10174 [Clostridium neonatale]|nr:hypothetical protein CNEO2_10174 [Clostridium neonatale]CAI3565259.1 hypothetical protein CNEO4_120106 [Clostridium neonatale]